MPITSRMRYVAADRWRVALALYGAAGALVGFIVKDLGTLAGVLGVNPKFGMAAAVNLALPGIIVLVTAWYPRMRTAWLGSCLVTLGFVVGALVRHDWHFWEWPLSFAQNLAHPVLLVGMFAGGVVGSITAVVARMLCQEGEPPDPDSCRACGYSLRGLETETCPECGVLREPSAGH